MKTILTAHVVVLRFLQLWRKIWAFREVTWSACLGRHGNVLAVSVRTTDPYAHAGHAIQRAIDGLGTAGGHGTMAGGQVPLSDDNADEIIDEVKRRLLEVLDAEAGESEPLARD